ncbi:lytic transglycosylase domain-containing protein [Blastococcus sp. TF02-8]|uniref:aggregation-promoting factor C-terminal-like domain-containing protein n=1 Tax=Blastococcus sp. TF02-8 TaxID=2250574 RepID=UPI000DE9EB2E|nr:transglycosylase SLT domain-containing protein [Blastococcus sp. TF02-8]RBY97723.1 lytic transglycosylase domain-containing protein [Blastococcus sp. TF02-8]
MNLRHTSLTRAVRPTTGNRRSRLQARRPALLLAVAAAGGLMVNVITANEPAAQAEPQLASVSVAEQLGITEQAPAAEDPATAVDSLGQLAASRSERQADQDAAAQAQAAADQAELDRRAAEEAARKAAEEEAARAEAAKAAEAAEAAAAARPGRGTSAPVAAAGSYQDYAMSKLGGSGSEFRCLENLWGKESGWNPNAQNPSSTAYGIPQFLDSTWKSTGIAKTSDGYRQIDAGLIYIDSRYGSPCGAWSHSQSTGWY